jgi:glutaredoxin-like protein
MVVEMDEPTRQQVRKMFEALDGIVTIHLFTEVEQCLLCNETKELVTKVAELSDKIKVVPHEGPLKKGKGFLGVQYTPALVLHGAKEYKIRFYGMPAGHEFGALIAGIVDVSTGASMLAPDVIDDIKAIAKPVNIKIFTSPQCPYCPQMVRLAWQAAILNPLIEAEGYESLEFANVVKRYQVFGTPKTIINETVIIEGLVPPETFVDKLYDAVEKRGGRLEGESVTRLTT